MPRPVAVSSLLVLVAVGALTGATGSARAAPPMGTVQIVQAVPQAVLDVKVDGKRVRDGVAEGQVLGPFRLTPGAHDVSFATRSGEELSRSTLTVGAGSSSDVVLHRPAAVDGDSVVSVYRTPSKAIGPGKARVLIAHTATVPPADVRVDGRTVFAGIANGEFATADIASGQHRVELVPTGEDTPFLGPVDVTLKPSTVTMVYAVGRPTNGSMRVIAHSNRLARNGTVVPDTIKTGSAGLLADLVVRPLGP